MAQWLVTQGNQQFSVEGLDELEDLARRGRLSAGDMVQPPGTTEWVYVSEIEELAVLLRASRGASPAGDDLDDYRRARGGNSAQIVVAVLVALIVIGGGAMLYLVQQLPGGDDRLIGGEGGLTYSEMLVTERGSGLRQEPNDRAGIAQSLDKDTVLELLSKRGDWYRARSPGGAEGWIPADQVIPMYMLGGAAVREEYDPLYNPDRYVDVVNSRWMQLPSDNPRPGNELSNVTVFTFVLRNQSTYPMTDLVIAATLKDAKGHELQTVEISVEGIIPAEGHADVGTLEPGEGEVDERVLTSALFAELAELDEELALRWVDGVEVEMITGRDVTNAEIDIVELRAIPDDEAAQVVRREE